MATLVAAGFTAVGCGGDDNDGGVPQDGGHPEGGLVDSAQEAARESAADAAPDNGASDAGRDSPQDSLADVGQDGFPPGLLDYPANHARALCTAVANCCPALGNGPFDLTACEGTFISEGWDNTLPGVLGGVIDGGHLTFNSMQAAACLSAIGSLGCSAQLTATQWSAITHACQNVLGGMIPIDAGSCTSSVECVNGAFCNGSVCKALIGVGGSCTSDNMCSSATSGEPAAYCNLLLSDGGMAESGTCQSAQIDGSMCATPTSNIDDYACASLLCSDITNNCGDPATNPSVFLCGNFADAGGGGG